MPQPTARDLHVDALLTNVSIAYRNMSYIADEIFPIVTVKKQSDIIPQYDQSHWFRDQAELRGPGTRSVGGGWTVDLTQKYFSDRFSYRKEISDDERGNADEQFNLDRDATEFVTDKLQMKRERSFAADFFTTGVWGTDKVGITNFTQWSDYANSNPLSDLTDFKDIVEGLIGVEPNQLVMGKAVWLKLKWHPDAIDSIKYVQKGVVSPELFASLVEFPKLLIGRSIVTTTAEGVAEASVTYTRIWGKHALMVYTPERPSLLTPSAGYTFVWQRVANALQYIKRMRDEEREVDIIESNSYFDQKKVGGNAGLFMSAAVA